MENSRLAELGRSELKEILSNPVEDELGKIRHNNALHRLGLLQNQLNHFRARRAEVEIRRRRVRARLEPVLEALKNDLVENQVQHDEVEKYIVDLLGIGKGRSGTGTLLPSEYLDSMQKHAVALRRMAESMASNPDGVSGSGHLQPDHEPRRSQGRARAADSGSRRQPQSHGQRAGEAGGNIRGCPQGHRQSLARELPCFYGDIAVIRDRRRIGL